MNAERELIVVKFGSESLVNRQGIDQSRINSHAERLAHLYEEHDVLVVTSGAVAWAKKRLEKQDKSWQTQSRRTLAMMGSAGIACAWETAFAVLNINAGQVLASHYELRDDFERSNFRESYKAAQLDRVIPILNHNDFMAKAHTRDDELDKIEKQKDNDEFSFEVAKLLGAKAMILATNSVTGLEINGAVQHKVHSYHIEGLQQHLYVTSTDGTGGMSSKLDVAAEAVKAKIRAFICNADAEFTRILANEQIGTEVVQ